MAETNLVNAQAMVGEVNIDAETVTATVEEETTITASLTVPQVVTEESNWRNVTAAANTLAAGSSATAQFDFLTDGVKFTFGIPKGDTGATGATGATGETGATGATGNGVQSFTLVSGTHAPGTTDTYRMTMTDGTTTDVSVYNGLDGSGSGDMSRSTYDTHGKNQDIFDYADQKYTKPSGGIPKTDLASAVQTSLGKADTALQEHQDISGKANKATTTAVTMSASGWSSGQYSFESTYPSASYDISIELNGSTATDEMVEAWSGAKICGHPTSNIAIAKGDVPTVDISIIVKAVAK